MSESFPQQLILPQWVQILKELGIPTLVGVFLGGIINYFGTFISNKNNTKEKERERRRAVAINIIKTIKSYNVVCVNEKIRLNFEKISDEEKKVIGNNITTAIKEYNEMEAEAALYLSDHYSKLIEQIKIQIPLIGEEMCEKIKQGETKGQGKDLNSFRKYTKLFNELKVYLKDWIK